MDDDQDTTVGVEQQPQRAQVEVETGTRGLWPEAAAQGSAETEILKRKRGRDNG